MRFARVTAPDGPTWARLDGDTAVLLTDAPWAGGVDTEQSVSSPTFLAPVVPGKIVAVGSNYPKHAAEMGKPVPAVPRLFLKPPSAVVGPNEPICIPPHTTRVDPEGELAAVMGRRLSQASEADAMRAVFGYTCLNDVTCRDFQKADGLFTRAKGFDSFCPMGPWIETELDPSGTDLQTAVNGHVRASGNTRDMVFSLARLVSFISQVMTLEPGDVVTTGTPPGVAPIQDGDVVDVTIAGIGTLSNPVMNRSDRVTCR